MPEGEAVGRVDLQGAEAAEVVVVVARVPKSTSWSPIRTVRSSRR